MIIGDLDENDDNDDVDTDETMKLMIVVNQITINIQMNNKMTMVKVGVNIMK